MRETEMLNRALQALRMKAKRWKSNQAEVRRLQKALADVSRRTPGMRRDELELGAAYAITEAKNKEVLSARACASAVTHYLYLMDQTGGAP